MTWRRFSLPFLKKGTLVHSLSALALLIFKKNDMKQDTRIHAACGTRKKTKVINVKNIKRRGWESEAAGDSDAIFPAITCEHDTV